MEIIYYLLFTFTSSHSYQTKKVAGPTLPGCAGRVHGEQDWRLQGHRHLTRAGQENKDYQLQVTAVGLFNKVDIRHLLGNVFD